MQINWAAIGATILPNIGGWAAAPITKRNLKPWFESLNRPGWRPPNWAFAPIWTGLYSSMGYASYLVYRDGGGFNGPAKVPLILYGTNVALNWAWPPIFFGLHNLKMALYEINLVTFTAAGTGFLFYRVNKTAGLLIVPYVLWMALATALTYKIFKDNPDERARLEEVKEN